MGTVHAGAGHKGRGPGDSRLREGSDQLRSGDKSGRHWKRQRRAIILHPGCVATFVQKGHLVCLQECGHKLEHPYGHREPCKRLREYMEEQEKSAPKLDGVSKAGSANPQN